MQFNRQWLILCLLVILFPTAVLAAEIVAIKGNRVLIQLTDEELQGKHSLWFAIDAEGKKKAVLQVIQVKENRAVTNLRKGSVLPEYKLELIDENTLKPITKVEEPKGPRRKYRLGFMGGYAMNTVTATPASSSISLSGNSFSLGAYYQTTLTERLLATATAGYESLVAANERYSVDIGYLGVYGQLHYQVYSKKLWQAHVGGGIGLLYAMNKSSNLIATEKIFVNQSFVVSALANYRLSTNTYLPLQIGYTLFPDNSSSSASQIYVRAGWAKDF